MEWRKGRKLWACSSVPGAGPLNDQVRSTERCTDYPRPSNYGIPSLRTRDAECVDTHDRRGHGPRYETAVPETAAVGHGNIARKLDPHYRESRAGMSAARSRDPSVAENSMQIFNCQSGSMPRVAWV